MAEGLVAHVEVAGGQRVCDGLGAAVRGRDRARAEQAADYGNDKGDGVSTAGGIHAQKIGASASMTATATREAAMCCVLMSGEVEAVVSCERFGARFLADERHHSVRKPYQNDTVCVKSSRYLYKRFALNRLYLPERANMSAALMPRREALRSRASQSSSASAGNAAGH